MVDLRSYRLNDDTDSSFFSIAALLLIIHQGGYFRSYSSIPIIIPHTFQVPLRHPVRPTCPTNFYPSYDRFSSTRLAFGWKKEANLCSIVETNPGFLGRTNRIECNFFDNPPLWRSFTVMPPKEEDRRSANSLGFSLVLVGTASSAKPAVLRLREGVVEDRWTLPGLLMGGSKTSASTLLVNFLGGSKISISTLRISG